MTTKTMALDLGQVRAMQDDQVPALYREGWYVDPATGQRIYYDAETDRVYTPAGGEYYPLAVWNPAPKQVAIGPGERLKMTMSYKYSGPAVTGATERFAIGGYGTWGFSVRREYMYTLSFPASTTPQLHTREHIFTMPNDVGGDWDDILCQVYGGSPNVPKVELGYEQALMIVGKDPAISEFAIVDFAKV